jgi:tetratricopeptide (TPR) repeat protein
MLKAPRSNVSGSAMARAAAARNLESRRLLTAGYSGVKVPGLPGDAWPMYIDSKCQSIGEGVDFSRYRAVVTDCSVHPGGSGQPLLSPVMADGRVVLNEDGRPKLEVLGVMQWGTIPGVEKVSVFMAFSYDAWGELRKLLETKMEGPTLDRLRRIASERDADRIIRARITQQIQSTRWPASASPAVRAAAAACQAATGKPAVEACTALLRMPNATPEAVIEALRSRGQARIEVKDYGPAVRDFSLGLDVAKAIGNWAAKSILVDLHAGLGDLYHSDGLYRDSVREFDRAVELLIEELPRLTAGEVGHTAGVFHKRIHINESHLRRFHRVLEDYEHLVALSPMDADVLNGRCYAYASVSRTLAAPPDSLERALADCNRALELKPGDLEILDSRAFTLLMMGRLEEARRDYDAVLAKENKSTSLYGRGVIKLRTGDVQGGEADIAEAEKWNGRIEADMTPRGLERKAPAPGDPGGLAQELATRLEPVPIRRASDIYTWEKVEYASGMLRLRYTVAEAASPARKQARDLTMPPSALSKHVKVRTYPGQEFAEVLIACEPAPRGAECIRDAAGESAQARQAAWSLVVRREDANPVGNLLVYMITAAKPAK